MASGHPPDGITDKHALAHLPTAQIKAVAQILLLGGFLVVGLSGLLGGGKDPERMISNASTDLTVVAPRILRNGELFELRVVVAAKRRIAHPVLAIAPEYLRNLTINTMIPAADKERFEDRAFRFEYPALKAGDRIEMKFDGQVNPALFGSTNGFVAIADGKVELARLPVALTVLP